MERLHIRQRTDHVYRIKGLVLPGAGHKLGPLVLYVPRHIVQSTEQDVNPLLDPRRVVYFPVFPPSCLTASATVIITVIGSSGEAMKPWF